MCERCSPWSIPTNVFTMFYNYLGQSGKTLSTRFKELAQQFRSCNNNSNFSAHLLSDGHPLNPQHIGAKMTQGWMLLKGSILINKGRPTIDRQKYGLSKSILWHPKTAYETTRPLYHYACSSTVTFPTLLEAWSAVRYIICSLARSKQASFTPLTQCQYEPYNLHAPKN
jgi:hypothetical protein